jgi:hypothetical protein
MTRCEMLSLKLKDVDLDLVPAQLVIPRRGAKRVSRERRLVLLGRCTVGDGKTHSPMQGEMRRRPARSFPCAIQGFARSLRSDDPAKHYREAAEHIFSIAGIENFWPNFCRHHAVSKGLRNPRMSMAMANEQFGWVNPKMQKRYYHGSLENLIAVAQALDEKPVKKSPATVPNRLTPKVQTIS